MGRLWSGRASGSGRSNGRGGRRIRLAEVLRQADLKSIFQRVFKGCARLFRDVITGVEFHRHRALLARRGSCALYLVWIEVQQGQARNP